MAWNNWFPWKFIVRRLAKSHGFLDPIALLARLERFAQPSEVAEPIELLRAGVILHARGLINSRVIQHNLDWVWPYWVERQFDPKDKAFVPRAFSITNINLTHRNWTAVGVPDCAALPIVDPRGLVTPIYDGWSLDGWVLSHDGRALLPSRLPGGEQRMNLSNGVEIETLSELGELKLRQTSGVETRDGCARCIVKYHAMAGEAASFVLALRPYNPEGVSFIHKVELQSDRRSWIVNKEHRVEFSDVADAHHVSDYRSGDVFIHLRELDDVKMMECDVGMATAAAVFNLEPGVAREIRVEVPLPEEPEAAPSQPGEWADTLDRTTALKTGDSRIQYLYDAAIRSLVLHSPLDVYPGPYTYKRFWFRDAAYIVYALLGAGMADRARRALDRFPGRQNAMGFFHSQDGEWDSNGEALWIFERFCRLTGERPPESWRESILKGARWIGRKRLPDDGRSPHSGLLPAGFSAEHLGPNDYYYWDDFWSVGGLRAASGMMRDYGDTIAAEEFESEAASLMEAIEKSLSNVSKRLGRPAIPASPYRRLDAGAIGSIVGGYPLKLLAQDDPRLLDTVNFLVSNCFVDGAFFQDMIHSGLNAYLTLEVAQVLLRSGNPKYLDLLNTVADLASPTGQWPEAIHPRTLGGCMGDGHHVWASAEWVLLIRNAIVSEGEGDVLILGAGLAPSWYEKGGLEFGPALTPAGPLRLSFNLDGDTLSVMWTGEWYDTLPRMDIRVPGWENALVPSNEGSVRLRRKEVR